MKMKSTSAAAMIWPRPGELNSKTEWPSLSFQDASIRLRFGDAIRPADPADQGPVEMPVLIVIEVVSGLMHGGAVVDHQHVAQTPFVKIGELGLDGRLWRFQEILRFLGVQA